VVQVSCCVVVSLLLCVTVGTSVPTLRLVAGCDLLSTCDSGCGRGVCWGLVSSNNGMLILILSLVLGRCEAFVVSCDEMPNVDYSVPGVLALDRLLSLELIGFMWLLIMYSCLLRA
jgi:hypothetical protein